MTEPTVTLNDEGASETEDGIVRVTVEGTLEQVLAVFGFTEIEPTHPKFDEADYMAARTQRIAKRKAKKERLFALTERRKLIHRAYVLLFKNPDEKDRAQRFAASLTGKVPIDDAILAEAKLICEGAA
jgi:hypothetical protein